MTQRTSGERFLPKQGGFETRPYKSPDLGAASRKRILRRGAGRAPLRPIAAIGINLLKGLGIVL